MKTNIWFLLLGLCTIVAMHESRALAKPGVGGPFGLGLVVGDPNTGIAMKYWTSPNNAVDGGISWHSHRHRGIGVGVHADYLIHDLHLIPVSAGTMPFYYGVGGFIDSHFYSDAGVRFPVGISYILPRHPIDFFLELAANLGLVPSTYVWLGLGLGGRFYF